MTTTTDRPGALPNRTQSASNLRLYLLAVLATGYLLAWWLFVGRMPAGSAKITAVDPSPLVNDQQRLAVWFHDLPPAQRPAVEVPAGWHVTDRTAPAPRVATTDAPVPVRVSPARAGRIRTRSS